MIVHHDIYVCNNGQRVHAFHWKGICGLFLSTALQQMVNVLQINVKGRRPILLHST